MYIHVLVTYKQTMAQPVSVFAYCTCTSRSMMTCDIHGSPMEVTIAAQHVHVEARNGLVYFRLYYCFALFSHTFLDWDIDPKHHDISQVLHQWSTIW